MPMLKINFAVIAGSLDWLITVLARLLSAWPLSWRSFSALLLGMLLAKWFWIFLSPPAIFTATAADPTLGQENGRIFGVTQKAGPANQGGALPNVQLMGVFTASSGKRGFAVIKIDAKRQIGVAEGEDAAPGIKLVAVHADHVTLERGGTKYRVDMVSKPVAAVISSKIAPVDYNNIIGNSKNQP